MQNHFNMPIQDQIYADHRLATRKTDTFIASFTRCSALFCWPASLSAYVYYTGPWWV